MTETSAATRLSELQRVLEQVHLPLTLAGTEDARALRRASVRQIDDYIAPRLANLDAPLLAVVGGSTGAGKSTLVNAIVGHPVTRTGAIRPTTRQPILLHAPGDADAFAGTRVLPGLARIRGTRITETVPANRAGDDPDGALTNSVVLVEDPAMPSDLALLDAPDIDSVADENRALAAQLLAAADLWVFVTTANRYADAVPWSLLQDAAGRDITVAVVLDRVPEAHASEIERDLRDMLTERGLHGAPVFVVPELPLDALGMLPLQSVQPIRDWLTGIAGNVAERRSIAGRTLAGAIQRLSSAAHSVAAARQEQIEAVDELDGVIDDARDDAVERVIAATKDGTLLRGEVLARWQDYVGTTDIFRTIETWYSRVRDRVGAWFQGRPAPVVEVETAIEHGLHAVVLDSAGRMADDLWQRLRRSPTGRQLELTPALARESTDLPDRAARMIRDWQTAVMQLISEQASGKRTQARLMSLGVNFVTVSLMVAVFASTGGLTGGEIAIAGGSAIVSQKLLETIFGEEAVRRLASQARTDLERRVRELLTAESERYAALVAPIRDGATPHEIDLAASALTQAAEGLGTP